MGLQCLTKRLLKRFKMTKAKTFVVISVSRVKCEELVLMVTNLKTFLCCLHNTQIQKVLSEGVQHSDIFIFFILYF